MMTEWAAATMKLLLWGALMAADIDLPPAKYDHPYAGKVQYVYDFPVEQDGDFFWSYTVPPRRKGAPCLIHLSPIGSVVGNQVMTEETLRRLIRHETGHCNGWRHREEAFTLIGRDDPFIVGPENPTPWPRPPSVPPAQTTDVRQRFCVSVIEPPPSVKQDPEYDPNRWLAVREGPGAKFEVVTKMGSVGHFEADAVDGDWTHVVDPEIQGWVSSKYVQECSAFERPNGWKHDVGGKSYQQQLERCIWEPEAACPD
jgi:hypothetical protein